MIMDQTKFKLLETQHSFPYPWTHVTTIAIRTLGTLYSKHKMAKIKHNSVNTIDPAQECN